MTMSNLKITEIKNNTIYYQHDELRFKIKKIKEDILSFENDFDVDKYFKNLESKNLVANKKDSWDENDKAYYIFISERNRLFINFREIIKKIFDYKSSKFLTIDLYNNEDAHTKFCLDILDVLSTTDFLFNIEVNKQSFEYYRLFKIKLSSLLDLLPYIINEKTRDYIIFNVEKL